MGDRCGKCTFRILPVEYIRIYGFYRWILPVEYCVRPLSTYGGVSDGSYIYKMLSAEDAPGMVPICERDKKRSLPSTPFLRAWAVREFGAKNRAIRDPAVRPQFPARQETRAGFQNFDFADVCQFRASENRVSEVFQARKTAKRQKNGNLRLAHTCSKHASGEHGGTARREGGGRRGEGECAHTMRRVFRP